MTDRASGNSGKTTGASCPQGLAEGPATRSQLLLLLYLVARILLALGITSVLGRTLGPDEFGFFSLVSTIFLVVYTALDMGSAIVAMREISRDPTRERELIEGLMGWRRWSGYALAVLILGLAFIEPDESRRWVLCGVAGVMLFMAPGALHPVFQVRQALSGSTLAAIGAQSMVLIGCLALAAMGYSGAGFAWLIVLRELFSLGMLYILAVRKTGYRFRPRLRSPGMGRFWLMALPFGLAVLSHTVYFYIDVFLVRLIRGEEELGAYAAAFRPINPLLAIPTLLMLPLLPLFAVRAREARERFVGDVGSVVSLLVGVGAVGATAGWFLAPDLVELLYGATYLHGQLEAVTAFRWLSLTLVFVFGASGLTMSLVADGRERVLMGLGTMGVLINVVGNVWLLPRWGFTAAAVTTAVTELCVCIGAVAAFVIAGGTGLLRIKRLVAVAPAAGLAVILLLMEADPLSRIAVGTLVGILCIVVLLAGPDGRRLRREISLPNPETDNTIEPGGP